MFNSIDRYYQNIDGQRQNDWPSPIVSNSGMKTEKPSYKTGKPSFKIKKFARLYSSKSNPSKRKIP